tara:strand:- start:18345 stop:18683 length:339 start_codon:yes stop_codon:yes gene_type:complete
MAEITRGDDLSFGITLRKNDATFTIDNTAVVGINFVDVTNGKKMLSADVAVTRDPTGSDWGNSYIIIDVPAAVSATLIPGLSSLEIQVNDTVNTDGKLTWHMPITVRKDTVA